MAIPGDALAEFADRIHAASVTVIVDSAPDWPSIVSLAAGVLAAGVDTPATVELACASPRVGSHDALRMFRAMLSELGLPEVPRDPRVLIHLVREDDIDALLAVVNVADIAAAWLRDAGQFSLDSEADRPDKWASWLWYSPTWYSDAERPRSTIVELIRQAETEENLARIAAGPLENVISNDETTLRWIEQQARISSKFRIALTHTWVWNQLSTEAFSRVQRAAGAPLPIPDR